MLPTTVTQRLAGLLVAVAVAGLARADSAAPAATDKLWTDLTAADEATVVRALLTLGQNPRDTVAFLKDHLIPVKADSQRVAKLVANLDSDQFAVREQAAADLEYLGKYIRADLEKALAQAASAEAMQRIQQLLDKLPRPVKDPKPAPQANNNGANVQVIVVNGQRRIIVNGVEVDGNPKPASTPVGPPTTWVRAVRAIALLEHINTPEARELLKSMAAGEADALPTAQAKAALERLTK